MIRYDENINNQILKTVASFNRKLRRLEKAGIDTNLQKVSTRAIKKEFESRRELESYLKELRRFAKRGSEKIALVDRYGNEYSRYEVSTARARQRRAIKVAKTKIAQAKKITRTEGGEKEVESLMGTDYVNNLQANLENLLNKKFTQNLSEAQQARLLRSAQRILGTERYQRAIRSNFYDILRKEAELANVDSSKIDFIIESMDKLGDQFFEIARNGEELIVAIEEKYPQMKDATTQAERDSIASEIGVYVDALYESIPDITEYYSGLENFTG